MPPITIITGAPVGAPGYTPGPEYTRTTCADCVRPFWVGPRQLVKAATAPGGAVALCTFCALRRFPRAQPRALSDGPTGSTFDADALERAWEGRVAAMIAPPTTNEVRAPKFVLSRCSIGGRWQWSLYRPWGPSAWAIDSASFGLGFDTRAEALEDVDRFRRRVAAAVLAGGLVEDGEGGRRPPAAPKRRGCQKRRKGARC